MCPIEAQNYDLIHLCKTTVLMAMTEEFVVIRVHVVHKRVRLVEKSRVKVSDARKCHSFPPACFLISRVVS